MRTSVSDQHAFYMAEPGDSYQTQWLIDVFNKTGLTQLSMAKIVHVSKNTVKRWLKSDIQLSYDSIYTICKELNLYYSPKKVYENILADKRKNVKKEVIKVQYDVKESDPYQVKWICSILTTHQLTQRGLATMIESTENTIANWIKNRRKISLGNVIKICEKLNLEDDPYAIYFKILRENTDKLAKETKVIVES